MVENKPSKEDEQAMLESIGNVKVQFDSVPNVGEFVNANSDIKFDSTYVTKKIYLLIIKKNYSTCL